MANPQPIFDAIEAGHQFSDQVHEENRVCKLDHESWPCAAILQARREAGPCVSVERKMHNVPFFLAPVG